MNIFHLLNRGVEKRKIFLDYRDYLRFTHNLIDFNTAENVIQSYYHRRGGKKHDPFTDVARPLKPAEKLVDNLCWCLLPNHPHLMAIEKFRGSISIFSKKIFGGYTKYFNEKNQRNGVLFQGRSKIILIKEQAHFLYLSFYIHTNPLDLYRPNWREEGIRNVRGAMNFLENYQWSSLPDIIGKNNFPEAINKDLFFDLFETNPKQYKKDLLEWLMNYKRDFKKIEILASEFTDVRRPL